MVRIINGSVLGLMKRVLWRSPFHKEGHKSLDVTDLAQGHVVSKWKIQNLNPREAGLLKGI